jgi:hypothetical protein
MKRLVVGDSRVFDFEADSCRSTDDFRRMYPTLYPSKFAIRLPHYDECWLDYDREQPAFGSDLRKFIGDRGVRQPRATSCRSARP